MSRQANVERLLNYCGLQAHVTKPDRERVYEFCDLKGHTLYTAIGIKEAEIWLSGYITCLQRKYVNGAGMCTWIGEKEKK